jgi:hypothetical protein
MVSDLNKTGEDWVEDWVDVWFEFQKDLGLEVNWHLGWTDPTNPAPTWIPRDHLKFDGVGGFSALLRDQKWPIGSLPVAREAKKPGVFRMVIELIKQEIVKRKLKPVKWRDETGKTGTEDMQRFTHGFNELETQAILLHAKSLGVSLNTLLLFNLNKSIEKFLLASPGDNIWLVPVNLRGPLIRKDITSNHVSFFPVRISPRLDVKKLGEITVLNIKRRCHWLSWYFINLVGKKRGRKGVYDLVKKNLDGQRTIVGIFTNLGVWPQRDDLAAMKAHADQVGDKKTWFVSTNNTPAVPVGGGAMTWFGRLGILVQVHPRVAKDQQIGGRIMQDWKNSLLVPPSTSNKP